MPSASMRFILAQFVQCEDERVGKYRCFYQGEACILALSGTLPSGELLEGVG